MNNLQLEATCISHPQRLIASEFTLKDSNAKTAATIASFMVTGLALVGWTLLAVLLTLILLNVDLGSLMWVLT